MYRHSNTSSNFRTTVLKKCVKLACLTRTQVFPYTYTKTAYIRGLKRSVSMSTYYHILVCCKIDSIVVYNNNILE